VSGRSFSKRSFTEPAFTKPAFAPTMQDLMDNPKAYGLPTFDEYCKDPDTYRVGFKRLMTELELGPQSYRGQTREIHYWVGINRCKTPERAMDIMLDMGWDPRRIDPKIDTTTTTAGKLVFNVRFYQKPEVQNEQFSGVEK
jgi:hypothetical protein